MLFHATIQYDRSKNPTTSDGSLMQLVDYSRWMTQQSRFAVKVLAVHWGTAEPIGFGVVESADADTVLAFLSLLPGKPRITVHPVEPLADAVQDGLDRLLAGREARA